MSGLPPRGRVTLKVSEASADHRLWASKTSFRVPANGRLGVSGATALFCSMRTADWRRLAYKPALRPAESAAVHIAAAVNGRTRAQATITRRTTLPEVSTRDTTVEGEGFVGRLYSPPAGTERRPGILLLGGSEGGLYGGPAPPLLAAHGYPSLALAYFGAPGLPQNLADIPLEYFERALRWLGQEPGVDPQRLVVFGGSRGAEAALLLGSVFPDLVHAVAAYSPSAFVNPGLPRGGTAWLLDGKPVPGGPIAVERIDGPVFLVAGARDVLWTSDAYTSLIVERLRAHGRTDFTALVYQRAGHFVTIAVPNLPYPTRVNSPRYGPLDLGGSTTADCLARGDSWPKFLRFLRALGPRAG
jgi:dienelactone hydrolase